MACMVKSVQRRASLGREEAGEHPSLHPTEGVDSGTGPPLQHPQLPEPSPAHPSTHFIRRLAP